MAIIDRQNQFSSAQAVTGSVAGTASTDIIDLGPLYSGNDVYDFGVGENVYIVVGCTQTTADTALTLELETDTNPFDQSTQESLWKFGPAKLVAGQNAIAIPVPSSSYKRHIRLKYNLSSTLTSGAPAVTALNGTFNAFLARGIDAVRNYVSASKIS